MTKRLIIKGANFETNAIDGTTTIYYSVTYNLSHCIGSNSFTSVAAGSTYAITITAEQGYEISSVVVQHNGMAVVPTGSGYTYTIRSVSGDITISATAIAESSPNYNNRLIVGYWAYMSGTGRLISSPSLGDDYSNISQFICTTKDGDGTAFGFTDGEISITIPSGCKYRVAMMKKADGRNTSSTSTDIVRSDAQTTTREIAINSNNIPDMLGVSASTYPYWAINIGKSDSSDVTVSEMIALGVNVEPTNTKTIIKQGYWTNHRLSTSSDGNTHNNFVVSLYEGGFFPFSNGEHTIKIPVGSYRVVLSSTIDGATGTMCRSNLIVVSSGTVTISSNDILSIMANNAASASSSIGMDAYDSNTNYLGWAIHFGSSTTSTSAATSPIYAITAGFEISKT